MVFFVAVNMLLSACWECVFIRGVFCRISFLSHVTPPSKGKVMLKSPKVKLVFEDLFLVA